MTPDAQRIYQLIIDAGGAKAGADMFKAAAEKISEASVKAAAAGKPLADSVAATEREYGRLVRAIDPAAAAEQRMARELAIVERRFAAQKISVEEAAQRITQIGQRYDVAVERARLMQQSLGAGGAGAKQFGMSIQQAGFQVGDFAVQVAGGSGVLRPFIQQFPQLLGVLGGVGTKMAMLSSVAGAVVAVIGALALSFWETEDATKAADDALDAYTEAMRASEEVTKALHEANDRNVASLKAERRAIIEKTQATIDQTEANLAAAEAAAELARVYAEQTSTSGDESTLFGGQSALAVAEKRLERIKALRDKLLNGDPGNKNDYGLRGLIAENLYGGENMDPFANMGGDFTGSYYDPTKKPKDKKDKDSGADAIADLQQQIALHGTLTREEKALYETSMGRYKDESAAEKEKILQLARILDLKESLADEEKKIADLAKKRDADEVAEYDKIIADASAAWEERVKRGQQLTDDVRTPAEKYLATVKELNVALEVGTINQETYNRQLVKVQDAFDQASEGTRLFRDAADDAMGILQAGLVDAAFQADNLKEALSGVLQQLAKMAANKAFGFIMDKGLDAFFGMFQSSPGAPSVNSSGYRSTGAGPGASANTALGAFSWLTSLFRFAGGGIMSGRGPLPISAYAGGGVATSPQVAMFAEGDVPEAFVPVPNGMIPVEIRGGAGRGGGTTVINNITIEGGGGTPEQNQDMAAKVAETLERRFAVFVDQRMADQQRTGGMFNQSSMAF